ncbi:MAG TPA: hypothetical protein VHC22_31630 [Pirellulales bacterium]|nr:hypothetical protein [Pirellulales bacterium]
MRRGVRATKAARHCVDEKLKLADHLAHVSELNLQLFLRLHLGLELVKLKARITDARFKSFFRVTVNKSPSCLWAPRLIGARCRRCSL